jgi:hypothetical protein
MVALAERLQKDARRDIQRQRVYDTRRGIGWEQLEIRYHACIDAREAVRSGENGAVFAERQALIDLASAAEKMAGQRIAPTRPI